MPRMTIRRLMAAIALVAVLTTVGERTWRRYREQHAARATALGVVEGRAIEIEIALFDRDGQLVGHAPFAPAHDTPPRKRRR